MLTGKWRTLGIVVVCAYFVIYNLALLNPKISTNLSTHNIYIDLAGAIFAIYFLLRKKPSIQEVPKDYNYPYYQKNINLINKFLKVTYIVLSVIILVLIFLYIKITFF